MNRSATLIAFTSIAAALTLSQAASAKCIVPSFVGITYPPINEVVIETSPNTKCAIHHTTWSAAQNSGASRPQKRLSLTSEPRHGSVEIVGNQLIYKSDSGYKGLDRFNYVSDNSDTKQRNYTYKVVVKVD